MAARWKFWRKRSQADSPPSVPWVDPMDPRGDGTLRAGDPMFDVLMRSMETGQAVMGNMRPDGTWETRLVGDEDERR